MPGDLDQVVAAMAPLAASGRHTHRVWLAPLPETITLREVLEGGSSPETGSEPTPWPRDPAAPGSQPRPGSPRVPGGPDWLRVPVGIVDKPFEQSQDPLLLDFAGPLGHLAVAGAPRSGKSTLLATLVAAFALTHPPDQAQFYCVDLGGGLLDALACLPHVGAVLGAHQPSEIRRLVRELRALVAEREQAFRDHRIASMAAWQARRRDEPALDPDGYGEVFLVVDNWARLRQDLPDLEPEIESLARGGLHYGVHLVVAANRWADLRLSLRDNLGGRLELRLNDPIESEVGRAAAARLLERPPGRGLDSDGHEFQVALPVLDPTTVGLGPEIVRHAIQSQSPTRMGAPPLRPLPTMVRFEDLPPPTRDADPPTPPAPARGAPPAPAAAASAPAAGPPARGVSFALHDHRLEVVRLDLTGAPHFLVLGDRECGKTATLRCVVHGLVASHDPGALRLLVLDYRRTLPDLASAPHCDTYAATPAAAAEMAARLRSLLEPRLPWSLDGPAGTTRPWRGSGPRYVLVVDDYDLVAAAGRNPLDPLLDLVAVGRDVGLHVLLARPVGGTGRSSFEPFYQRVRETGCPGLIMSGDPREGPLLGGRSATPQPAGRGYLVTRRGRPGLVQVAWTPPRAASPPAPPAPPASPARPAPPAASAGPPPAPPAPPAALPGPP
ncbi:MAG TPA: type VII secretion protein EccCb [Actinomycetes bacterium]|nr:type VII secretion protein EccCb [Actinomycetes bacterium]